jgi:hypothetical protein
MALLFLTWILVLFFSVTTGTAISTMLRLKPESSLVTIIIGLFGQCFALTCCSFFWKLGLELFLVNFSIQIALFIWQRKEIIYQYKATITEVKHLAKLSKFVLILILAFSLAKCAQLPFIIDNESYYIQTIKWLNEYGFVKGLANLHIFLGQNSPFHVLQAGFNFSFISDQFNDLNGFVLVISSLYFMLEFEKQFNLNKKIHWIGLVLIFNMLFFQFVNTPSPDLIIILVSQIILYIYIEKENNSSNFKVICLLFLFLFFIKITIAPIGLLLLLISLTEKKRFVFFLSISLLIVSVLIIKNTIITGYPFYPATVYKANVDWRIPDKIVAFMSSDRMNPGYFKESISYQPTLLLKLKSWFMMGGINRIFNLGCLMLFVITPFTFAFKSNRKIKIAYLVLLFHFVMLLFISPQFRFFLPEFIFLFVLVLDSFFQRVKIQINIIRLALLLFLVLPLFLIEFIDFKRFTKNKLHQTKSKFSWVQIVIPENNSKYPHLRFEKITEGNLEFYSPKENFFFYGTANGDLPCVNKVQINHFKNKINFVPQLRTTNIKDGFYSKKVSVNE